MAPTSSKFDFAINSLVEKDGYCLVESATEDEPHIVTFDKNFYSTKCTCKAGRRGVDCRHRLAVDRYFDDRRPSFHQMCGLTTESTPQTVQEAEQPAQVETAMKASQPSQYQPQATLVERASSMVQRQATARVVAKLVSSGVTPGALMPPPLAPTFGQMANAPTPLNVSRSVLMR